MSNTKNTDLGGSESEDEEFHAAPAIDSDNEDVEDEDLPQNVKSKQPDALNRKTRNDSSDRDEDGETEAQSASESPSKRANSSSKPTEIDDDAEDSGKDTNRNGDAHGRDDEDNDGNEGEDDDQDEDENDEDDEDDEEEEVTVCPKTCSVREMKLLSVHVTLIQSRVTDESDTSGTPDCNSSMLKLKLMTKMKSSMRRMRISLESHLSPRRILMI